MTTSTYKDVHSVTNAVTQLLTGLGFDTGRVGNDVELAIDKFDQWTNPRDAMVSPSTDSIVGSTFATFALQRVA